MGKNVKVYSTPGCPYCKMAKKFLQDNSVVFEDIDVSNDQKKADEMIRKSGQMGVPVLDIDGTIIVGFEKEAIKQALDIQTP